MNLFGTELGIVTLLLIGLGFFWVIRLEYHLGLLWWPYVLALGVLLIAASAFIPGVWGSALPGIAGASLVWGATELKDQAARVEKGWYPANPHSKPRPPFARWIEKWRAPSL